MGEPSAPGDVIEFWLAAGPDKWWAKDDGFDAKIAKRFAAVHDNARAGKLGGWMENADGALALILVLDQFSRNLYRNDARAFACDAVALDHARTAVERHYDWSLELPLRQFFYMPFMHAEELEAQDLCVALTRISGGAGNLPFARVHRDIIRRFRRFPHRNQVLGRPTSPAERAFLEARGFSG